MSSAGRRTVACAVAVLLLGLAPGAFAAGQYTPCAAAGDAVIVAVSGAGCDEARAVAIALAAAPGTPVATVLGAAGWAPLRAAQTPDGNAYDLVATRGLAALRLQRPGTVPDLDGWAAGRRIVFARTLVPGGVVRHGALCTAGFLVRIDGRLGGLSAGHCGGVRSDGTTQRHEVGLSRRPQPGIILGRVARNLARTNRLDALVVPVPSGPSRPASAVIDRGPANPPWFLAGAAIPYPGLPVCMTGVTSGPDRCGRIVGAGALRVTRLLSAISGKLLRCTTIPALAGDSGGPVYTAPGPDGTVQALGTATVVATGLIYRPFDIHMCFTPIAPVLAALGAQLVTAG